jgi:excisionase family DNA binding protein
VSDVRLSHESVEALADAIARRTARTTLRPDEAAARLGISRDAYDEHVAPHLREVRVGRLRLVRVAELERWAAAHEARPLETR